MAAVRSVHWLPMELEAFVTAGSYIRAALSALFIAVIARSLWPVDLRQPIAVSHMDLDTLADQHEMPATILGGQHRLGLADLADPIGYF